MSNLIKTDKASSETQFALISQNISFIQNDIKEIKDSLKTNTVTKDEFQSFKENDFANVKRLVYGAVGLILVGFVGALLTYVLAK